jgi:hypothetical protein
MDKKGAITRILKVLILLIASLGLFIVLWIILKNILARGFQ